jgi:hypothetical protein
MWMKTRLLALLAAGLAGTDAHGSGWEVGIVCGICVCDWIWENLGMSVIL